MMEKIKAYFKSLRDYRHWILLAAIAASAALIPFCFPYAHLRIWESVIAFGGSCKYYVSELFNLDLHGTLTVNDFTTQPFHLPLNLPRTWEEFKSNMSGYWSTFFSEENFSAYMEKVAMPCFWIEELLYDWAIHKFRGYYYQYRYNRGDSTLPMYLIKQLMAKAHHYYAGIYNRFGYCTLRVQVESGTQDGQLDENKYFLMSKKIYSKRFSTDCFSDFFTEKALRSPVGIDDLREYAAEKASFEELAEQNSYFINDLLRGFGKDRGDDL